MSVIKGKQWSELGQGAVGAKARDYSYIGRIIETELGEKLEGDRACTSCWELGQECWAYLKEGVKQVKYTGSTCAQYRVAARSSSYSNSTQVAYRHYPIPPPSFLLLKGPGGLLPGVSRSNNIII